MPGWATYTKLMGGSGDRIKNRVSKRLHQARACVSQSPHLACPLLWMMCQCGVVWQVCGGDALLGVVGVHWVPCGY